MAPSDSEDDNLEDLEYDGDDDPDQDVDDEPLDGGADDATEAEDISGSDSDDGSEEEEDEESEPSGEATMDVDPVLSLSSSSTSDKVSPSIPPQKDTQLDSPRKRSLSPAQRRKMALTFKSSTLSSYTVEAICALPHPAPTHALASSFCMTHLLTGSDDGYIRDYDIFSAVNGKNVLSAPQRSHSGVVEGTMKAGQLRFWWENPVLPNIPTLEAPSLKGEDGALSPVYSLAMHSDALWALAGTDSGHINLFTVRHEPGRLCHAMNGHRGPVSALSLDHSEKGYFSAGWDGEAIQWDLNTGQRVRNFTAHGAQLAGIAVRPMTSGYASNSPPVQKMETLQGVAQSNSQQELTGSTTIVSGNGSTQPSSDNIIPSVVSQPPPDSDANSDASFDPLFDDEPDASEGMRAGTDVANLPSSAQASSTAQSQPPQRTQVGHVAPPKNAPPLLDPIEYATYSPNLLMTVAIDGQIILWDKRVNTTGKGVGRLWTSEKTPPWCLSACWSADGGQLYAGRRNGTVDVWDVRQLGRSGPANTPRLLKTLRNPLSSGVVSCVVAFPDCRHIACASVDNLRLWNVADAAEGDGFGRTKSGAQFKIIPGHHGGYISQMIVNPAAKFLVSASSNRGWHGDSTRTVFIHDIKQHIQ